MTHDDLPLFNWTPPVQVIPFPLAANVGKVRRVAEVLDNKHGKAADAYWRRTVQPMADRLTKAGVSQAEVDRQIVQFTDAVQQELNRLGFIRSSSKTPER